jgi:PAS domain S-box-containing protein
VLEHSRCNRRKGDVMARIWSKLGIASQLYLLGAVVFLPIAVIIALNSYGDYREEIAGESRNAFRHARNVAEQTARFHRQSFEILQGLARRPAIRGMSTVPCDPVFDHFLSANKSYANLLLDNADGDVICNAAKGPNLKGLVTHRPWFKSLMTTGKRQVGDPTVGRVVGRWIAALTEPVVDEAGRVRGALVLTVDLWNYQFHLDRDFSESFFLVTILDSQGAVMARSREPDQWVGKKIQIPLEAIRSIKAGDTGFIRDASGVEQLYGHAAVPETDWVVLVSSPKSAVIAEAWERIRFELTLASLMLVLLFAAAILVAKRVLEPVKAIARAAEAVGRGRFDVHLPEAGGNRELSTLAQKFNRMVEQRSAAETRQAQAMTDLAKSEERLQRALDASRLALWDYDLASGEVYLSEMWSELLGGPRVPTTTTFEALTALTPAEDQTAISAAMMPVIKGERQSYQVEHRVHKPDGEIIWILSEGRVVERGADGRALRAVGTNRDITERKRAEKELRERDARLRLLTENIPAAVAYFDRDRVIQVANQNYAELYRGAGVEMVGRHARDVVGEKDWPEVAKRIARVFAGESVVFERTHERPDGERREIEIHLEPDRSADGEVRGYYAFVLDITKRKRLDQEQRRDTILWDSLPIAIGHADGTERVTLANRMYRTLFGDTREHVGRTVREALGDDIYLPVAPYIQRALAGEESQTTRPARRDDGSIGTRSIRFVPERDAGGRVVGFFALIEDVTELKRGEAQQRLAASVFDNAAEGILITDKDNNILSVNCAFTEITGYSPEEAIGKNPSLLSSGSQPGTFYEAMWTLIRETGRWQGEVWDRRKDGRPYCELLSIAAIRDDQGKITQHCAIFSDITRLKMTEAELMALNAELEARVAQRTAALDHANKELETFSYSVSHDLRAPLHHLSGFSAIVLKANEGKLDAASVDYLKRINAASERMGRLIADLLALSRVSRQELNKRNFDLSELAGEVANSLVRTHPGREVRVTVEPEMKADGDPGLVRIVLENLIGNAWKFTSRTNEPRIEVGLEERDGETVYCIRDNGAGFDMKYAGKLFGAFQRLHTLAEFEGTGIGLSIVQRIVVRHGGRIWAEAEVGKGATFYFTLRKSARPA